MIRKDEIRDLLSCQPCLDDILPGLLAGTKMPKGVHKEIREVVAYARKFNQEVARPLVQEMDMKMFAEPDHLPWDFVRKANDWGLYSLWIPRIFGGKGYAFPSLGCFIEEISSVCLSMANLIGVHYLGVATLSASWNAPLITRLCKDVVEGEKTGNPCLISLAITEPGAGTDVEEVDLVDRANLVCHARPTRGGYILNGTKVFISNGHLSTWHIVIAYTDLNTPSENTFMAAVKTGSKGFSFGRKEKKMGQKACPASELVFKDCFIPEDQVCIDAECLGNRKKCCKDSTMQLIDYVTSVTRAGVCAFGTGAARGAYETALDFSRKNHTAGKRLIDLGWVQALLADMYANVALARLAYMETNAANGIFGFFRLLQQKPMYYLMKWMPEWILEKIIRPLFSTAFGTYLFRLSMMDRQTKEEASCTSGWGSLAKVAGTDLAMENCHKALDLMGQAGIRHDGYAEKILRDAKLLQIYEGTNQLNRINIFKCMIAGQADQPKIFDD